MFRVNIVYKKGTVEISSEIEQNFVTIKVKDTGIGIRPEMQEQIFELINEKTETGTLNEAGTGLGLVICKDFVEKMGGNIWVESIPGKGSVFSFTLRRFSN
jgi:signal transduction histidine kinase